ncbi:hypothetical protein K505DRAFT_361425 [Melanomma pulvis-pyrius CBS 109.77]|uniref:Uncharacterized protein n=1 Tax=Melanomma pulvis-pyrius CBS 109.77 TaxID=1314802 RepID=A0A6A6XCN6_9PLEO|nr:hypothetical protein K505DRAFT_361425 [Melanomma pulvis-pyrius CBS 109.77]
MFFGTPHLRSNKANLAEIATQITSLAGKASHTNLASSIKLDFEILDNIHTDFLRLLRLGQFYIHNFIEGKLMAGIGKIVEDYSSKIPDITGMQIHEVIDGDHRSMNRYSTAQDARYRKVISALRHYMNKLDKKHGIERMCDNCEQSSKELPAKPYFSVP